VNPYDYAMFTLIARMKYIQLVQEKKKDVKKFVAVSLASVFNSSWSE